MQININVLLSLDMQNNDISLIMWIIIIITIFSYAYTKCTRLYNLIVFSVGTVGD